MRDITRLKVTAVVTVLAVLGTACDDGGESVEITAPEDGTSIEGNVVEVALDVSGIEIAADDDSGDGDTGLFHVFVDRDPVAPGEAIPTGDPAVVQTATNPIQLTGLSVGRHRLVVVLGDKDRKRIGDAVAETAVDVKGPSVDMTGPVTAQAGKVIQVEVALEGVGLVEPADDESDTDDSAGRLHLFVNRDPTPPGEAIPTDDPAIVHTNSQSVAFPADLFKEGKNTIWVVLGDADDTSFDPPVLDKLEVEVS